MRKIKQRSVAWDNRRQERRTEVAFVFFSLMGKGRNSNVPLAHTQSWCRAATTAAANDETQRKERLGIPFLE